MPVRVEKGAEIRVFSGSSGHVKADTLNYQPVTYVELRLEAGATVQQDLPGSYNGFVYVLEGSGRFGTRQTEGSAGWLSSAEESAPSHIEVSADQPLRALVIAGLPIREHVVQQGPFVMNSQGEIKQAYADYYAGKFGPLKS